MFVQTPRLQSIGTRLTTACVPAVAVLVLLVTAIGMAAPQPQHYEGLFEAAKEKQRRTFLVLLVSPANLQFSVTDRHGQPLPQLKVTRVAMTANDWATDDAAGLTRVRVPDGGIYEIQVEAPPVALPLGFRLSVVIEPMPAQTAPSDAGHGSALTAATGSGTASGSSSAQSTPPVKAASATAKVASPTPMLPPVAAPVAPMAASTAAPVAAVVVASAAPSAPTPVPSPTAVSARLTVSGDAYIDPYQPIEVVFTPAWSPAVKPEAVLTVSTTDGEGTQRPMPGRRLATRNGGVQFVAERWPAGAVVLVSAHTPDGQSLATWRLLTLPEINVTAKVAPGARLMVDAEWRLTDQFAPTADAQVLALDGRLEWQCEGKWRSFDLKRGLPPSLARDGIVFRGSPGRFSLNLPLGNLDTETQVRLVVPILGNPQPTAVWEQTLVGPGSTSTTAPASGPAVMPPPTTPPLPPVLPTLPASAPAGANPVAPPDTAATGQTASEATAAGAAAAPGTTETPSPATATPSAAATPLAPIVPPSQPIKAVQHPHPGQRVPFKHLRSFAMSGEGIDPAASWPRAAAFDPQGFLWVVDNQNRRVVRFDLEGKPIAAVGRKGSGPGELGMPTGIAVAFETLFIGDTANHCLHVLGFNGEHFRDIGSYGVGRGQFDLPHGIELSSSTLVVADRGNCRIGRFTKEGVYVGGFGTRGRAPGQLQAPVSVRVHNGLVWVLDVENSKLLAYEPDGRSRVDLTIDGLTEATDMVFDPWGRVLLADADGHRVLCLDPAARSLIGTLPLPTVPHPWVPTALALRADGLLAVGDGANRMIHLFELPKP